ncbi:MAG TPA: hypothetical protein VFY35_06545 [Burkholderiaceae bacterium]|nr:hypothetical protein [Burkholderiaceae bacterium]
MSVRPAASSVHRPWHRSPSLLRHIGVVLVVKLLVLTALWWAFVRDQRVQVQADQPALPWLSTDAPSAERNPHGQ